MSRSITLFATEIRELHPAAQVAFIVCGALVSCWGIYWLIRMLRD